MIRYIVRILWNTRRSHRMIIIEQMLVFIVLSICFVSVFDILRKYSDPGMLDTDNTVLFSMMSLPEYTKYADRVDINKAFYSVFKNACSWEQVEYAAETSNLVPYLRPPENYWKDSLKIGENKYGAYIKFADPEAQQIFNIKITEGTWLRPLDNGAEPIVISQQLADIIDCHGTPVGLTVYDSFNRSFTVVGVFPGIKESPFTPSDPAIIVPLSSFRSKNGVYRECVFKIKTGTLPKFSTRLYNECRRLIPKFNKINISILEIDYYKSKAMFPVTSRLKLMVLPSIILLLFAFVGSFGLLMLDMRRRTVEFGLHRAVGATRRSIVRTVILQNMILTAISSIPGIVLLPVVSGFTLSCLYALLSTIGTMFFFSFISAAYPAWKVSIIAPADILREE